MSLQRTYQINPEVGFPGQIAEPNSPHRIEVGYLHVDTGAARANPRPGDSVFYNDGQDAWQVPITGPDQLAVGGILTYRADAVQNVNSVLEFSDNDQIFVVTMGVVWVIAGGGSERGNILTMQVDDWKYNNTARVTAITDMHEMPIENFHLTAVVDNQIFKAAIGYGRAI